MLKPTGQPSWLAICHISSERVRHVPRVRGSCARSLATIDTSLLEESAGADRPIYPRGRRLAAGQGNYGLDRHPPLCLDAAECVAGDVGGQHHVVQSEKRVVRVRRFLLEYVESGGGDPLFAQGSG